MPQQVAHAVFFKLREPSPEGRQKLVASCHARLAKIAGIAYFAAGERGAEFDRDVNDEGFDVGLMVVFESKAAHDAYQTAVDHQVFVAENRDAWASVRVFDPYV
ncbi:MAG: Dabb family protein [Lacipirellulaceae bacterium]